MESEIDRDVHSSIVPAVRLIIAGIFVLLGITVLFFQIGGKPNEWVNREPWNFTSVLALIICAVLALKIPLKGASRVKNVIAPLKPAPQEPDDFVYDIADSIKFYDRVADIYDARLTREYRDTLRCTAALLKTTFPDRSRRLKILDLGAGTGQFIGLLEGTDRLAWTCLEPAPEMAKILRRFFAGPPMSPIILEASLEDVASQLDGEKFDAVVLNSLLSSLPKLPDLGWLSTFLEDDGVILISDGHPDIRSKDKTFRIRALDGNHSLKIEHRAASEIVEVLTRSRQLVQLGREQNIRKFGVMYSYVLCFSKSKSA